MSQSLGESLHTSIWQEVPEQDNPYAAALCRAHGYDVYGQLLGRAGYIEYFYLLLKGERPTPQVARALDILTVAIANPGPRDPSVHAAMAVGATGGAAASALISALSAGAGSAGGAREVLLAMQAWLTCGTDLDAWRERITAPPAPRPPSWPQESHAPGFDPHGVRCATPVLQYLSAMATALPGGKLAWLEHNRLAFEKVAGAPLAQNGVTAAAFIDLDLTPEQGEMLTLLWRLPGAAMHALEQGQRGFRQFPYFELALDNDPGPKPRKEPQ